MSNLFEDFWSSAPPGLWDGGRAEFLPQIDVSETSKEVRITAELPGLEEKDVEVTMSGNMLNIKGEKSTEMEEDEEDFHHSEHRHGYFDRAVALPQGIDADKANAKFKNGVLKVTVPKSEEAQNSRKKIKLQTD